MRGSASANRYRAVDLFLFAGMLAVFESVIILAETQWFPGQPYTVSLTAAITAIVMLRWGPWAAIHAALGGAVLCLMQGGGPKQYLIYCGGNLLSLLALPLIRLWGGGEALRQDAVKTVAFGLAAVLLMQAGRALLALALGTPPEGALALVTTDVVSGLFTALLLWIARRGDGLLENQYHYLRRLQAEQEEERGGFP